MQLVPLHDRLRHLKSEQLLVMAIEGNASTELIPAIDRELDARSLQVRPRQTPARTITRTAAQRPSLLRWLDPATRPALPASSRRHIA